MKKTPAIQNPNTKIGKALQPILKGLSASHQIIQRKTQAYHDDVIYDIVEMGLWFLKAKKEVGHGNFDEFVKNFTAQFIDISKTTVWRYMQAATNAGLTFEASSMQVDKMREAQTLHGLKPTELYKLAKAPDTPPEPPKDPQLDLFDELFREFSTTTTTLLQRREQVPPDKYDEITNQLHDALCKWSDCDWEPRERGSHKDGSSLAD